MSLYDKMLCLGSSGCGHPRHMHSGTHVKGSKTACTKDLGNKGSGRHVKCSCCQFSEVRPDSPDSEPKAEAAND